ncbi:MAG: hypothetical protein K8I27_12025 [Planctomycetes bacterium]|nr:hypothetical protein [Planctomycetota bacterium]
MAALENIFVPVMIKNNNGNAHEQAVLKEFKEPAWNNPVARIIDAEKKDVIPRINGVYTAPGVAGKMLEALDAAGVELGDDARAILKQVADGREPSANEVARFRDAVSSKLSRELHKSLSGAVKDYEDGKFGKAAESAARILDDEKAEAQAKDDAGYLVGLVDARFNALRFAAEAMKGRREYLKLFAAIDEAEGAFKGYPGADKFFDEYKTLAKDKEVKAEVKALEKLAKLEDDLREARTDSEKESVRKQLESFAEKNQGTKAAEKAAELLKG